MSETIPSWAWAVLASPGSRKPLRSPNDLFDRSGRTIGRIDNGVLRFALADNDPSIAYYRDIGGAHFHERAAAPYAMSTLDTPVYHGYLRQIAPRRRDSLIVDVGGGDGRNALPWLEWGFKRVVVIDPVAAALWRFRDRVAAQHPEWLDRLLLIEGDARALPLRENSADRVLAIEALCYLNEDYEKGLRECRRIMQSGSTLLLSDRSYEGGLLTRLLYYGGIDALLEMGQSRKMSDGVGGKQVRTRCFTREELLATVKDEGFRVVEDSGISMFALMLSFLSNIERLGETHESRRGDVSKLLSHLGRTGAARRCHVVIATRGRRPARANATRRTATKRRQRRS